MQEKNLSFVVDLEEKNDLGRPRRKKKGKEKELGGIVRLSKNLSLDPSPRQETTNSSLQNLGRERRGRGGSSSASSFLVVGFNQRIFHFIRRLNVSKIDGPMMINHGRWWRHDEEKSDPAAFIHEDDFHAKEIREITRDEHFSAQNFSFFFINFIPAC